MRASKIALIGVVLVALGGIALLRQPPEERNASDSPASVSPTVPDGSPEATVTTRPSAAAQAQATSSDGLTGNPPLTPSIAGDPPVRLAFRAPERARVGETIDLTVDVEAERPVDSIVLTIRYDAALLRVRTVEELDYANAAIVQRFSVVEGSDSRAVAKLNSRATSAPIWRSHALGVVQLEALAPGHAQLAVASVDILRSQRSLSHTSVSGDRQIAIEP